MKLRRLQFCGEVLESCNVRTPLEGGGTLDVCFDHVSSYYRSGYLAAYAYAYKEGYAAGECARQTVRLRYGSHSVKYRYASSCRY